MLYHIIATHTAENCPGYNEELQARMQEFTAVTAPKLSEELGVKIHFVVTPAPEHVVYMLCESDDYSSVTKLLLAIPIKQDFEIKQVVPVVEVAQN
jgi:hypothetical protein